MPVIQPSSVCSVVISGRTLCPSRSGLLCNCLSCSCLDMQSLSSLRVLAFAGMDGDVRDCPGSEINSPTCVVGSSELDYFTHGQLYQLMAMYLITSLKSLLICFFHDLVHFHLEEFYGNSRTLANKGGPSTDLPLSVDAV